MPRKPSSHRTEVISVRLGTDSARRIRDEAEFEGITASAVVRRLVLAEERRRAAEAAARDQAAS
jgi:hypothetical protein